MTLTGQVFIQFTDCLSEALNCWLRCCNLESHHPPSVECRIKDSICGSTKEDIEDNRGAQEWLFWEILLSQFDKQTFCLMESPVNTSTNVKKSSKITNRPSDKLILLLKGLETFGNRFLTSSSHIRFTIHATYKIPYQTNNQKSRHSLINFLWVRQSSQWSYLSSHMLITYFFLFPYSYCIEYRLCFTKNLRVLVM